MTENVLYTVFWEDMNDDVYLYGSSVKYFNTHYVCFEDRLMPAGVPIKEWQSFVDYQAARHEPRLPLFAPGEEIVFRACCKDSPRGTVIFRVTFYDRQKQRIDSFVLNGEYDKFVFPEKSFSYVIQLVNGGTEQVTFGYMELCSASHTVMHKVIRRNKMSDTLHILVPERRGRLLRLSDEEIPDSMTNVTALSPEFFGAPPFYLCREILRLKMNSYNNVVIHCAGESDQQYTQMFSAMLEKFNQSINVKTEYWDIGNDK